MLKSLRLENFKSFKNAELSLGELTVLVGTNASGKSNIRDAFRFLHGISRGYSIAEIIGEKYGEGGVLQWRGIRGGTKEISYCGEKSFAISISFSVNDGQTAYDMDYFLKVRLANPIPVIIAESLTCKQKQYPIFKAQSESESFAPNSNGVRFYDYWESYTELEMQTYEYIANYIPVISQVSRGNEPYMGIVEIDKNDIPFADSTAKKFCELALTAISDMRFLDLSPDLMRLPTFAGQNVLGDRGENLSSVMQDICRDENRKAILLDWLHA